MNFENTDSDIQITNWQQNTDAFDFGFDQNIDDGFVSATGLLVGPHETPVILGTFEMTVPNGLGNYNLSVESDDPIRITALTDENDVSIPILSFGTQEVRVVDDPTSPFAILSNPAEGSFATEDLGYLD